MIAKCANPACRTRFDHHIGGKFFRFCLTEAEVSIIPDATQNPHNVIHYWLCPVCSKLFSLVHAETGKVILRVVDQQLEISSALDQPTAA
jgi:hypothetical protein